MVRHSLRLFGFLFLLPLTAGMAAAQQAEGGPPPATAQGLYLSVDFSVGSPNDPQADGVYEADLGLETGLRLGMGYAFGGLRLEGQLGYEGFTLNNVNPLPGGPLSESDTTGELSGPVFMANLLYDFGTPGGTRPFLGAGVGFARMEADYHGFYCSILPFGCWDGEKVVGGSDTVMAWQGMAGISRPLSSGRGDWYIGYRYFATDDIGLNVVGYGPVTQEGVQSHSVMLGWRWRLQYL